jgi:hypothetical protein
LGSNPIKNFSNARSAIALESRTLDLNFLKKNLNIIEIL